MSVACEKAKQGQRCINVCLKCQIDNWVFFFWSCYDGHPVILTLMACSKLCFSDEVFEVYGVVITPHSREVLS